MFTITFNIFVNNYSIYYMILANVYIMTAEYIINISIVYIFKSPKCHKNDSLDAVELVCGFLY